VDEELTDERNCLEDGGKRLRRSSDLVLGLSLKKCEVNVLGNINHSELS
jgi:hypothetical protein